MLTQAWAMSSDCGPDRSNWGPAHLVEERDACGVGFIADIAGKAAPGVVLDKALVALGCMEHRGACSADQVRITRREGRAFKGFVSRSFILISISIVTICLEMLG